VYNPNGEGPYPRNFNTFYGLDGEEQAMLWAQREAREGEEISVYKLVFQITGG
jgi:hypothetical protein